MPNPFGAPEISVREVEEKRQQGAAFVWLDVREAEEVAHVQIDDERVALAPLSQLTARQLDALPAAAKDPTQELIVFCHHGMRSAQVTAWLAQQGWTKVTSMAGGVDAWANQIDPTIGTY